MQDSSRTRSRRRPAGAKMSCGTLIRRLIGLVLFSSILMPFLINLEHSFSMDLGPMTVEQMFQKNFADFFSSKGTSVSKTQAKNDTTYCLTEGSLHQIALRMANFSSPPGSRSYEKASKILQSATHFKMQLNTMARPIFDLVHLHIRDMMEGFGLKQIYREDSASRISDTRIIRVESILDACSENCTDTPRIIVQSEQVGSIGTKYKYLQALRICHNSPHCLILDYSDFNYRWAQQHEIADSVFLLPLMTQSRLGFMESVKPLHNRSLDVVFFTSVTEGRRVRFRDSWLQNKTHWSIRFEGSSTNAGEYMKNSYNDAKICLIMHYYNQSAAGEYHRLSEFGPMGCIPVLETFGDQLFLEPYRRCARAIFAGEENLVEAMEKVLNDIKKGNIDTINLRHVEWWRAGIQWSELLKTIFGNHSSVK